MTWIVRWLALAAIVIAGAAQAQGLPAVRGRVIDRATQEPVAGAVIAVGNELVATDDDGRFIVALPRGNHVIEVSAPWLTTVKTPITVAGDLELVIEVDPAEETGGERIEIIDIAPTAPGETKDRKSVV